MIGAEAGGGSPLCGWEAFFKMLLHSGYAHHTDDDSCRSDRPLIVSSCGHYRMQLQDTAAYTTLRPGGRRDYQLLFVASGRARFGYDSPECMLPQGHVFLYRPGEAQAYSYPVKEYPDIYWMHFTGSEAAGFAQRLLPGAQGMGQMVGIREEYARLFERIIRELQLAGR